MVDIFSINSFAKSVFLELPNKLYLWIKTLKDIKIINISNNVPKRLNNFCFIIGSKYAFFSRKIITNDIEINIDKNLINTSRL